MKGFKDTNNKLNGDIDNAEEQAERRSKAYAKIIGEQSNYMAEQEYQRQNYRYFKMAISAIKSGQIALMRADSIRKWQEL